MSSTRRLPTEKAYPKDELNPLIFAHSVSVLHIAVLWMLHSAGLPPAEFERFPWKELQSCCCALLEASVSNAVCHDVQLE